MPASNKKRLLRTTFIFSTLLLYVIAALVWWFISLERQNQKMANDQYESLLFKKDQLELKEYNEVLFKIDADTKRNTSKYIAEGITFLALILVGAYFVFRSIRRQFKLQMQQQNFMMAVTHELKTPVSVARLNLETLQKYSLGPEKQNKLIRNTLDETTRLNFLISNILISSQLEGNRYDTTKEDLNLSSLTLDCIDAFKKRFPERIFNVKIEPDADIKGDPLLLQILVNNLLENAIKYSPKDCPIIILLKKEDRRIVLEICDQGPGIPEEEKKKIFSKFYRIGSEETRKTQGTGLGLYLCKNIARKHNADILVTNQLPHGSNFVVTFYT